MHLWLNCDNNFAIILVEHKIRKLCNIYNNGNNNIVNVWNSIEEMISYSIDASLYQYENVKTKMQSLNCLSR